MRFNYLYFVDKYITINNTSKIFSLKLIAKCKLNIVENRV